MIGAENTKTILQVATSVDGCVIMASVLVQSRGEPRVAVYASGKDTGSFPEYAGDRDGALERYPEPSKVAGILLMCDLAAQQRAALRRALRLEEEEE